MDFVGNALAPNVLTIRTELAILNAERVKAGHTCLKYKFPDRAKGEAASPVEKRRRGPVLNGMDPADELADLQASFGFGPFVDPTAREKVFGPDTAYEPIKAKAGSALFAQAGISTAVTLPTHLHVYSVSPFVMLVDERALGDVPCPQSWEDLLCERYRGKVVVTCEDPVGNIAALSYQSLFGADGLRAFYANVCCSASASIMGRMAGSAEPHQGAVYVAPWFFARMCSMRPGVRVIWPSEGALSFPLWLAQRKGASEGARAVASYFTGDDFAQASARQCLPCANAMSDACLPMPHASLHWVGWDFLKHLDIASYSAAAQEAAKGVQTVSGL